MWNDGIAVMLAVTTTADWAAAHCRLRLHRVQTSAPAALRRTSMPSANLSNPLLINDQPTV